VEDRLADLAMHRMDITHGAVLESGCVYIIPLLEGLALRHRTSAMGNPKSSTGRLDIFTRLITDYGTEFDRVREGYRGPLYAEVSPAHVQCAGEEGLAPVAVCASAAATRRPPTRPCAACSRRSNWSART